MCVIRCSCGEEQTVAWRGKKEVRRELLVDTSHTHTHTHTNKHTLCNQQRAKPSVFTHLFHQELCAGLCPKWHFEKGWGGKKSVLNELKFLRVYAGMFFDSQCRVLLHHGLQRLRVVNAEASRAAKHGSGGVHRIRKCLEKITGLISFCFFLFLFVWLFFFFFLFVCFFLIIIFLFLTVFILTRACVPQLSAASDQQRIQRLESCAWSEGRKISNSAKLKRELLQNDFSLLIEQSRSNRIRTRAHCPHIRVPVEARVRRFLVFHNQTKNLWVMFKGKNVQWDFVPERGNIGRLEFDVCISH